MSTTISFFIGIILISLIDYLIYYIGKRQSKQFIKKVTTILESNQPIEKSIEEGKTFCRNTKGVLSSGIYLILDKIVIIAAIVFAF